tara:strand:+ start:2548 stop:2733 length:186 start_codon:yes stop_codon:yes gene_type:complete
MRPTIQNILDALDHVYEETDSVNQTRMRLEDIREHIDQLLLALELGAEKEIYAGGNKPHRH